MQHAQAPDTIDVVATVFPEDPGQPAPIVRPGARSPLAHPTHWLALGFGTGLSRMAPGTAGTLWAWLAFVLLSP